MATPDLHVIAGALYRARAKSSRFTLDGGITGDPCPDRTTPCTLTQTNGDLGIRDCANWGDRGPMVECRSQYFDWFNHCTDHGGAICTDLLCAEV